MTKEEFERANDWVSQHKTPAYRIKTEFLDMPVLTDYIKAGDLLAFLETLKITQ